jgi:hypothetical protein
MLKIYYARPMSYYDTQFDNDTIKMLQKLGFEVVNPNNPWLSANAKVSGMTEFIKLVKTCDALAFYSFPDHKIGAGVANEDLYLEFNDVESITIQPDSNYIDLFRIYQLQYNNKTLKQLLDESKAHEQQK